MSEEVIVPVDTLRRAIDILLDHLVSVEGQNISLDKDMFWTIAADQRNDVYVEPTEFSIGQLSESLESIDLIVNEPSTATSYALVWVADVLRAAGEAVVR